MTQITVTLPIPPRCLHPNYTVGSIGQRMQKATATKNYRGAAYLLALGPKPRWKAATVSITYYFKDKRRRDRDGLLSWLKAAFDGFADAQIVENDADFTYLPVRAEVDKAKTRVEITIRPSDPQPKE